jgi:predicted nucleic acid-binding protein
MARLSVLIDTNVILDVVLARPPWAAEAVQLLDAIGEGRLAGSVAGHAVTTVAYLVERAQGRERARTAVADVLEILEVVPLEGGDFLRALSFDLKDYEDAVQVAAALRAGAAYVVTRNPKHFKGAPVPPRSAGEVLALLASTGS